METTLTMTGTDVDKTVEAFAAVCRSLWAEQAVADGPRFVARAPARLDVMGGIADYTGSLVLQWLLPLETRVGVAPRTDQKVSITSLGWSNNGDAAQATWPLSALYTPVGKLASPEVFSAYFDASGCAWARHVAGVFHALLEAGVVPHFAGGASIIIQSDIRGGAGIGASASISVATGLALTALLGKTIAPIELARLCQRAENLVVGAPRGISDKVATLLGGAGSLLQVRCQPHELLGPLRLCAGTTVIGIDSRVQSDKQCAKYAETRVASFMGMRIIDSILRSTQNGHGMGGGYLANITPTDYVERFRDRLPTKMRGRDFLERYGHIDDPVTRVNPDTLYKVRSRSEHHIYENDRVHRFAERLIRAARTGERDALIEAGELMYASHWSYSQRCGMGSIETDILVNLLREVYGAKVTSAGCGGTLAVLIADTPATHDVIRQVCEAYAAKTGREPRIYSGSAEGAAGEPPRPIE